MKMKWIPGFEGLYKVSECGKVFSEERNGTKGGLRKTSFDRYGYEKIVLHKNDKPYHRTVHRVVAETFIQNLENKATVNHKDGNKLNNHVSNLEWHTSTENWEHSHKGGKQPSPRIPVIAININTGEQTEFISQREAAKALGINQTNVRRTLNGEYKQTKGYTFKRKEG